MQKQCGEMRKKHGLSTFGGTQTRQTTFGRLQAPREGPQWAPAMGHERDKQPSVGPREGP